MAQIDSLTQVGLINATDLALIIRAGGNVLATVGTMAAQGSGAVDINGGTIDATPIGATTPSTIAGTTGTFSGNLSIGGGTPAAIEGLLVTKASGSANIIVQNIADLVSNDVVSFAASAGPRTKSGTVGVYKHAGIASSCAFIQLHLRRGS